MRLGDYYRGLPLNLRTPLPPDEVARRIGGAICSPLRPFATGIVGYAPLGRLQLRFRKSLFSYNGMPVLVGPVRAERGGSLLILNYRGHLATRLAFPLAFLVVGAGVLTYLASGAQSPAIAPWQMALIAFILVLAMALPLGLHAFFIRNAEGDLAAMADFLRTTLEAKDVPAPPGWTGGG